MWRHARPFLIASLLLLIVYTLFFWRLGSMTSGLGPAEYASRQNSQDSEQIISRGINAPYHLTQHAFSLLIKDSIFGLRLASVVFGLVILVFLFLLLRSWFGKSVALFAGLVFAATPWLIVTARTASPNILLLWPVVMVAGFVLMNRSKRHPGPWWLLLALAIGVGVYTPGIIWVLLGGGLVASRRFLLNANRMSRLYLAGGLTIVILLISPLAISLALESSRLKSLFLIPDNWLPAVESLKSVGWSAASLFWSTRNHVDIGIGRLPVLNILQVVLMVFGLYALSSRARNITYGLLGLLVFSILAAGVNADPHVLILGLPAAAILMAAGLRYLYIEWRHVFPLNPFAHSMALGLISLVVAASLLYGARYSLTAWPHSAEAKSSYVLK